MEGGGGGRQGEGIVMEGTIAHYMVSFISILARLRFPVEGCPGIASTRKNLGVKFSLYHRQESIVILEEGNQHHPQCPQCDMFVPQEALNQVHLKSAMCWCESEKKRLRLVVEETEEWMRTVFLAYGTPLTSVPLFNYLIQTFFHLKTIGWQWNITYRGRGEVGKTGKTFGEVGIR